MDSSQLSDGSFRAALIPTRACSVLLIASFVTRHHLFFLPAPPHALLQAFAPLSTRLSRGAAHPLLARQSSNRPPGFMRRCGTPRRPATAADAKVAGGLLTPMTPPLPPPRMQQPAAPASLHARGGGG
eukprot:64636-Chlamydomonas_euryale.AAC.1